MGTNKNNATEVKVHAIAQKSYGIGLWDKVATIATGVVSNLITKPLAADVDPRTLPDNTMHYQRNKFGDVQIVLKYAGAGWCYAGVIRDKEGDPITSDANKYELREVKCRQDFKIPDTDDGTGNNVVIEAGFTTVKAYALED